MTTIRITIGQDDVKRHNLMLADIGREARLVGDKIEFITPLEYSYENEMCKSVGLRTSCNSCDRIVYAHEPYFEGGYCRQCALEVSELNNCKLETIETIK